MNTLEKTALIVSLITDIAIVASIAIPITPFASVWEQIPLIGKWVIYIFVVIIAIVLGVILWRKSRIFLDPKFKDLKIYYSNIQDSPFIDRRPNHPYYVVNNATSQAYYVPDFIADYIRRGKVAYSTYPDKEALHSYFDSQNIGKNLRDASDEELGLWLLPNRKLVAAGRKLEPQTLEKLRKLKSETKFKELQIISLFPWYCWFLRLHIVEDRAWPPNRRIIADYSKNEAYAAPPEYMDLFRNGIISLDSCTPRPTEDIETWCKRKRKLTYKYRTFVVEELLVEHH